VRYNRGAGRRLHLGGGGCSPSNFCFCERAKSIGRQNENKEVKGQRESSMESVENRDSRKYIVV